jgi:5-methyltetrahydrofolate--homocysteine methyltransferase
MGSVENAAAKAQNRPANKRCAAMRVVPQDGAAPDTASGPEIESTLRPVDYEESKLKKAELLRGVSVPTPPFYGASLIEKVPLKTLVSYLNERMLYQFHWGYRKEGRKLDEYMAWARKELRPITTRLLKQAAEENILQAKAAYGYWKCAAEGDDVVLFDENGSKEVARFAFPRQKKPGGLCIADFFRDVSSNERDVIGLQVVTMGHAASETARQWFAQDRYQDYLYLHGLGVEMFTNACVRNSASPVTTPATSMRCCPRAIAARVILSVTPPVPTWRTRGNCCICSAPTASASH